MAYERHDWVCGETVTEQKMNNIEDGIEEALECCGGGSENDFFFISLDVDAETGDIRIERIDLNGVWVDQSEWDTPTYADRIWQAITKGQFMYIMGYTELKVGGINFDDQIVVIIDNDDGTHCFSKGIFEIVCP